MRTTDPVFLEMVKRLKEEKPITYQYRKIDLYNNGQDAVRQETIITGNVLNILCLPRQHDVYIQFNEPENTTIRLTEGTYLINFYRIFLTFKHTEKQNMFGEPYLLKMIFGKDLISVQYPVLVEKTFEVLVDNEYYTVPEGAENPGFTRLFFKRADPSDGRIRIPRGYTQLRAMITSEANTPRKFRVYQGGRILSYYDEQELPAFPGTDTLLLDLVGEVIRFDIYQEALAPSFDVNMFAILWSM